MHAAFAAGCASFSRDGYRFGDPMEFLHPAGHDHWQRPDFRGCPHCSPPVQGKVVLLYAKADSSSKAGGGREGWHGSHDGESRLVQLVEVYGRDVIRTDKRSWERHWRGLAIGMRIVQRMSKWSTTAESVRDLHKAHLREAERARERDRGDGGRPASCASALPMRPWPLMPHFSTLSSASHHSTQSQARFGARTSFEPRHDSLQYRHEPWCSI